MADSRARTASLRTTLSGIDDAGLYRRRRVRDGGSLTEPVIDGRRWLAFCSNDYLGLAGHPQVTAAMQSAADLFGAGSGAAHLVTGHTREHHALEDELADFTGRARALLFSTGYMANLGIAAALVRRGGTVLCDRLNHASLLDAASYARARCVRYRHADASDLAARLTDAPEALVMTDGVFSMDGDMAPLPAIVRATGAHDRWLVVDDAHGFGVLGTHGRGTPEHFGLGVDDVPVLMGTLGKALGVFGAFVAGSEELIELLIQRARTYVYTTAPPPALAAAARAALKLVQEETWRREQLCALVARFRAGASDLGLPLAPSDTPIQPLIVGGSADALRASDALAAHDILVSAIRPPTVPRGSARLRITLSAAHTEAQVDRLLDALASLRLQREAS